MNPGETPPYISKPHMMYMSRQEKPAHDQDRFLVSETQQHSYPPDRGSTCSETTRESKRGDKGTGKESETLSSSIRKKKSPPPTEVEKKNKTTEDTA